MSDSNHDSTELFAATEVAEGEEDAASTTEEAEPKATSESEESTDQESKRTADEARADQLSAWKAKIIAGKADLGEAPGWLQDDLKKALPKSSEDLEALVDAKLEEKLKIQNEQQAYESMHAALTARKLSDEQKITIQSEFNDLVEEGLQRSNALEKAVRIANVPDVLEQATEERRKAMTLPKPGNYTDGSENKTLDNIESLKDDEIVELAMKDTNGLFGY